MPLPPGVTLTPIILLAPRILIPIRTLSAPIILIPEWFHVCRRRRRQGRAPEQAGQHEPYADERQYMTNRVTGGTHVVRLLAARPAGPPTAAMAARRVLPQ